MRSAFATSIAWNRPKVSGNTPRIFKSVSAHIGRNSIAPTAYAATDLSNIKESLENLSTSSLPSITDLFHDAESLVHESKSRLETLKVTPSDFTETIRRSASEGFLYSLAFNLTDKYILKELRIKGWKQKDIDIVNQIIRGIILLMTGKSISSLITPVQHCLLVNLGMSEEHADYVSIATAITLSTLTNPLNFAEAVVTFASGLCGSIAGRKASELFDLIKDTTTFVEEIEMSEFRLLPRKS